MLGKVNEYKVELKEQEQEEDAGEGGEDYDDVGENMKQEQHIDAFKYAIKIYANILSRPSWKYALL